jgi:hypothetical protein
LKALAATGVLHERKEGRENVYSNVRFFDLLTSDDKAFERFG